MKIEMDRVRRDFIMYSLPENKKRSRQWQMLNTMADNARLAIIAQIVAAFDGVEREEGISLHEARVIDCYGSEAARKAAKAKDTDRRWQDISDIQIEDFYNALIFLDAKGFRYYIPAYAIWSLKHYMTSDSLFADAIVYALEGFEDFILPRFELLNREQSQAIYQFLEFSCNYGRGYVDVYVACRALKHWDKMLVANFPRL